MNWIDEIRQDISKIQSLPRDLKKFGITIGGFILVLCCAGFFKGWWNGTTLFFVALFGMIFILSGIFYPRRLRTIHLWWMSFAIILGSMVSRIILFIVFFTIVSLISLAAKIFGKKFSLLYKDQRRSSFWIQRDQNKNINYERMS